MARGGRAKMREGPERRCLVTGESGPTEGLVRFVRDPEGVVAPDLAERLPGRGAWVTARRDCVERAAKRNLFSRAFRAPTRAPEGLAEMVGQGLARRLIEAIGLARKAGLAVAGFEKARARLRAGPVGALIEACDGSPLGRDRLRALAAGAPVIDRLTGAELGLAFGREIVIHAVLDAGGATDRAVRESRRLSGFRDGQSGGDGMTDTGVATGAAG